MHPLEADAGDDGTVFRDVIMLALLGFVAIVILLLPHLNPPVETTETASPGNVVVEVRWPDELNVDVDLWVEAPGDQPVGYSNKGGRVFNLLRDDLGHYRDPTQLNYEFAFSRGAPAGEYTVNLHLYRNQTSTTAIPVKVAVSLRGDVDSSMRTIAIREVLLRRTGQEVTVVRFSLDENGALVAGSIHAVPKPLRSERPSRRRQP